jgi:glutaredoxin
LVSNALSGAASSAVVRTVSDRGHPAPHRTRRPRPADESLIPARVLCDDASVLELWQAEWCPHSHRVRLRLTELGIDWIARTVPLDRDDRDGMEAATGGRAIPTLVDGETVIHGADAIIGHLDTHRAEPVDAARHRAQMRAEWPHWVELEGE